MGKLSFSHGVESEGGQGGVHKTVPRRLGPLGPGLVFARSGGAYVSFMDSNVGGRTYMPIAEFARFMRGGAVMAGPKPPRAVYERWSAELARYRELSAGPQAGPAPAPRRVDRRGEEWRIDGRLVRLVGSGGSKVLLLDPASPEVLVSLFSRAGSAEPSGSREQRDLEIAGRKPLIAAGLSPRILGRGALSLKEEGGTRIVHYLTQERVEAMTLEEALAADRGLALGRTRVLFDRLIAARVRLADEGRLGQNIMIGRTASQPRVQAWVVDAAQAEILPRSWQGRFWGRPDPLRGHYDLLFERLARQRPGRH